LKHPSIFPHSQRKRFIHYKPAQKILPLLLILILNWAILTWHFWIVDYEWFEDGLLSAEIATEDERAEAK